MSKHEFALILLAVCFGILAVLFLVMYIVQKVNTNKAFALFMVLFVIFAFISIYFGYAYYKDAKLCKICGEKAVYSTGFGNYCVDCHTQSFNKTCSRCGDSAMSYVSYGGEIYCRSCATITFGSGN